MGSSLLGRPRGRLSMYACLSADESNKSIHREKKELHRISTRVLIWMLV